MRRVGDALASLYTQQLFALEISLRLVTDHARREPFSSLLATSCCCCVKRSIRHFIRGTCVPIGRAIGHGSYATEWEEGTSVISQNICTRRSYRP